MGGRRPRLERGYSQAGFAEAACIDRALVEEIEKDEATVTIVMALKVVQNLGMILADLFSMLEQH